ncbi:MAG: GGDEF domain-containing protein [Tepidisphaeraceae bacterium]|jgi:diguanylate cyclase (GGDEF)-like protein
MPLNADLINKIRQCPNLPSLPAIAIQVLDLAGKADVDIAEIARIISKDPALSTKILRTVNSSFYGRSQHVSTISHALVILGLQSVKTLVLGFSLVSNLTKNKAKGFKHLQYWRRSVYAATAARIIAVKLNVVQQEEAFLSALLQDIGMLVLDMVLGQQYSDICESAPTHKDLVGVETTALGASHAAVGMMLAEQWKLPPILTQTIGASHDSNAVTDPALKKLAEIVELSGWCADVFMDADAAGAIAHVRGVCANSYKVSQTDCDLWLAEIGATTREVASLFEINIGAVVDYDAILKKANETLVELNLQSQMQASQLQEQNQALKIQATIDALTGLNNRASFDQFLMDQFAQARKDNKPVTLLMMDVDKFKTINDRYGHQIGDQVLTGLGKLLRTASRAQDLPARYGGEELVLILPGTPRGVGAAIATTICKAVAAQPIACGPQKVPVTVSIGVATMEPGGPLTEPAHLIKAADMAVYAAKHGGRNCVKIFKLKSAA